MPHWVWIPAAILLYVVSAHFTVWANNKVDPDSWKWVVALYILNLCGLWPLIARYSTNILVDGLLYDLVIFFTFYVTLVFMGAAQQFNGWQWFGCLLAVLGFVVMKIGELIHR